METHPTILQRLRAAITRNPRALEAADALRDAMQEAATEGDPELTAAIANLLRKQTGKADEAAAEEVAAAVTGEGEATWAPDQQAVLDSVREQLASQYPDAVVTDVIVAPEGAALILDVNGEAWSVPIEAGEDGPTLGAAERVMPAEPEGEVMAEDDEDEDEGAPEGEPAAPTTEPEDDDDEEEPKSFARRPILVSVSPTLLTDGRKAWVNILNLGAYQHEQYGEVEFTRDMFDAWQRNFRAGVFGGLGPDGSPRIAVDYAHAMDGDAPADQQKAAGYVLDLKLEDDRVYALIEFTRPAAAGIKAGEWAWYSVSIADSVTDQRTGLETGPVMLGGALTNRPFIPGLEPIQLSDLRPTKATLLARELQVERARRHETEARLFAQEHRATLTALEAAGVPRSVIALVTPALEADERATVTLALARNGPALTPGRAIAAALLELARVGLVPKGELTGAPSPTDFTGITLQQAIDSVRVDAPATMRQRDLVVLARRKYPHLRNTEAPKE